MVNRNKKNIKIIILLISIVFISSVYFIIKNDINYRSDYTCLSQKDPFLRDFCYYNRFTQTFYQDYNAEKLCYNINNNHLEKKCIRISHRYHMWGFINGGKINEKLETINYFDQCNQYTNLSYLFCVYLQNEKISHSNISKSIDVCNNFLSKNIKGECYFNIVISIISNLKNKPLNENIDKIKSICSNIDDNSWKSECYYLLADELAALKKGNFIEIAQSCSFSNKLINYACFDHVTHIMEFNDIIPFCNSLSIKNDKIECYKGYGKNIGNNYQKDPNTATQFCLDLNNEFEKYCFEGLGKSFGWIMALEKEKNTDLCEIFPDKYKRLCYRGYGKSVGWISINASYLCRLIPEDYRNYCYKGLGTTYAWIFGLNINEGIKKCTFENRNYTSSCFIGFGKVIEWHSGYNYKNAIADCNKITEDYKNNCYYGIGQSLGHLFSNNVSLMIKACDSVDISNRGACYKGLGYTISWHHSLNPGEIKSWCNKFQDGYRNECIIGGNEYLSLY